MPPRPPPRGSEEGEGEEARRGGVKGRRSCGGWRRWGGSMPRYVEFYFSCFICIHIHIDPRQYTPPTRDISFAPHKNKYNKPKPTTQAAVRVSAADRSSGAGLLPTPPLPVAASAAGAAASSNSGGGWVQFEFRAHIYIYAGRAFRIEIHMSRHPSKHPPTHPPTP